MATVNARLAVIIDAQTAQFNAALSASEKRLNKFEKNVMGIGKGLLAGYGLMEVGSQIIQVTSEFQKFEAILTNTLGSQSAAASALKNIKDFAITTPFEVSEITAAYVRWANQGLTPTIDRMRKLGDVASSLGAGFEQTAEAFKDLALGQTKRIEEVGISAQQSNGKIQLSFKGVNLEIEKNAEGVQKALDVYSQLNGVLGTSDAVSKTLGGRISNLKDAWDQLMLSLGEGNKGPLFAIIESLTTLTTATANWKEELELIGQAVNPFTDLKNVSQEALDYALKFGRTDTGKNVADVLAPLNQVDPQKFFADVIKYQKQFVDLLVKEGESTADASVLFARYVALKGEAAIQAAKLAKAEEEAGKKRQAEIAAAKAKEDQIKAEADAYDALIERLKRYDKYSKDIEFSVKKIPSVAVTGGISEDKTFKESLKGFEFGDAYLKQIEAITDAVYRQQIAINNNLNALNALNGAFGDAASQGLQSFLVGLGDVAAGNITFGQNILNAISGFMKQFGQSLIAIGVAKIGLDNLFKSGPQGAIAAIAAGTALVVAAGALNRSAGASIKKIGSGGGGMGGGMNMGSGYGSGNQNITITGKLVGSGRDLVAVIENTNFDNSIRKGG